MWCQRVARQSPRVHDARFRDRLFPGWDFKRQHRSADRSWAVMASFARKMTLSAAGVCRPRFAESATDFQCEQSFCKPRFSVYNSPFHQFLIEKFNHLSIKEPRCCATTPTAVPLAPAFASLV